MPQRASGSTRQPTRVRTICSSRSLMNTTPSIPRRPSFSSTLAVSRLDMPVTSAPLSISAWYGGSVARATVLSSERTLQPSPASL
eukprot:2721128-Pyramimonas_sp.AAC.2